jgi:hypothetical protein
MKTWFLFAFAVLLTGCATATYRPYIGEQQKWPTAPGSIINTQYELPAFMCLPSAPYEVLGELKIRGGLHGQPAEECLPELTKKAQEIGADALLVVDGQQFFAAAAAARSEQSAATNLPAHTKEVGTPVTTRSYGGYGGYGGYGYGSYRSSTFMVMKFDPNVVILAIRWTAEPPEGLPKHGE